MLTSSIKTTHLSELGNWHWRDPVHWTSDHIWILPVFALTSVVSLGSDPGFPHFIEFTRFLLLFQSATVLQICCFSWPRCFWRVLAVVWNVPRFRLICFLMRGFRFRWYTFGGKTAGAMSHYIRRVWCPRVPLLGVLAWSLGEGDVLPAFSAVRFLLFLSWLVRIFRGDTLSLCKYPVSLHTFFVHCF